MDYLKVYNETYFLKSPQKNNYIYNFPYECDNFQKYAFHCIEQEENVLVTAHTGSGKTAVAIYAIAYWLKKMGKIIYVSPIKSLSNEKYKEILEMIHEINIRDGTNYTVGILTGDIKINPNADCIVMTTEILRNALYKIDTPSNEQKDDKIEFNFTDLINCVIFDEVHYISDEHRGTIWEESIVLLNPKVQLIMLSATVDNSAEFASWIGTIKQKYINLIPTSHRVVPLEHYMYANGDIYKIMSHSKYNSEQYHIAKQKYKTNLEEREKKHQSQFNINVIPEFVKFLKEKNLFQTIIFSFSRANCEKYAGTITTALISREEIAEIEKMFDSYMQKYKHQYENLLQYQTIRNHLLKGIAYHHSGLLPILKEIVELIFKRGLVKVLFATETFAVGVNMPTRTVCFTELEKFTGGSRRSLTPTEYIQMSGRAGRRGKDTIGNVIILPVYQFPSELELQGMLTGTVQKLKSKFSHNYSFQLKIPLSKSTDIQTFISHSLFEVDNRKIITNLEIEASAIQKQSNDVLDLDEKDLTLIKQFDEFETSRKKLEIELGMKVVLSKKQQKDQQKIQSEVKKITNFKQKYDKYTKYMNNIQQLNQILNVIEANTLVTAETSGKLIQVLTETGYISRRALEKNPFDILQDEITVKGLIASQINECNPLLLTELIVNDKLNKLNPIELITVLSIFIDDGKIEDILPMSFELSFLPKNIMDIFSWMDQITQYYQQIEKKHQIHNYEMWELNYNYVYPAYLWANMKSIHEITSEMNIYEGNFVKNMLKLSNIIRDLSCLCKIHGSIELLPILNKAEEIIVRDIVTVNSLYIN